MEDRLCVVCRKKLEGKHLKTKKYCSNYCRKNLARNKFLNANPKINNKKGIIGTISEYRICTDLMMKGFEIYKSISNSSTFDLAIAYKDKFLRVEVTTGSYSITGKLNYAQKNSKKFDILAVVTKQGDIFYFPELEKIIH